MSNSSNHKLKLLYLMKILQERTDPEHPLTLQEITSALSEYGIRAERKSIYSDIELLRTFGLDIEARKAKSYGYYVDVRDFELPELKLLVDAVQSSRFITRKKSKELIRKLSSLTSIPQAKQLDRQAYIADRPKNMNEDVYYSVDAIHSAISENRKIRFKYFDYSITKKRIYRKEGAWYYHTPLALCWSDDKYYLVCYYDKYDDFTHYRADRMSQVEICEEAADAIDPSRFNVAEHIQQVFGMYSGKLQTATLRFDNSLVNTVFDKFGTDTVLRKNGDCFEINVQVSVSPVFLSWMLQFGDKAEIIAPDSLRDDMWKMISTAAKKYDPVI